MPKAEVTNLFKKARAQGRKILTEPEAKQVLHSYGIPVANGVLVNKKEDAIKAARKIRFPLVMKVVSPDIVHKTEAGAVAVGLQTESEVEQAFGTLQKNARAYKKNAKIHGVLLQEMLNGTELIIGSSRDVQFGQTIMFGIGGIFVEILKDVSFRVVPINRNDSLEMLNEIKGRKILAGVRGQKPLNENAIVNILLKTSQLLSELPQIKELDINPLFANEKEAKAADARIILE